LFTLDVRQFFDKVDGAVNKRRNFVEGKWGELYEAIDFQVYVVY
jgi:hypothetical protein